MRGVYPSFFSGSCPVDELGEDIQRLFVPEFSSLHRRVPASKLVTYTAAKQVCQLQILHPRTGALELDRMTVVVSIDGACRNNGKPTARASWGVYFGPGSPFNAAGRLDAGVAQTNSRAEIEALSQALDIIKHFSSRDYSLQDIKIRCDSEYLCQAMAMWMEGWIENGGRRSNGRPVAHFDKLKEIHDKIDEMTYGDDGGLRFGFWHVPRESNRAADELANQALDE